MCCRNGQSYYFTPISEKQTYGIKRFARVSQQHFVFYDKKSSQIIAFDTFEKTYQTFKESVHENVRFKNIYFFEEATSALIEIFSIQYNDGSVEFHSMNSQTQEQYVQKINQVYAALFPNLKVKVRQAFFWKICDLTHTKIH